MGGKNGGKGGSKLCLFLENYPTKVCSYCKTDGEMEAMAECSISCKDENVTCNCREGETLRQGPGKKGKKGKEGKGKSKGKKGGKGKEGEGQGKKGGQSCTSYGEIVAKPFDCRSFLICVNGQYIEQSCGDGLYWDNNYKVCNFEASVNCQPGST